MTDSNTPLPANDVDVATDEKPRPKPSWAADFADRAKGYGEQQNFRAAAPVKRAR